MIMFPVESNGVGVWWLASQTHYFACLDAID